MIQLSTLNSLGLNDTFYCSSGEEFPMNYLCDFIPDCDSGEDEGSIICSGKFEELFPK